MNSIRQIQELNKRELENGVSSEASWHADYRDTAYIYIGGLPFELSEGDIITIFSQFGEPTYINLVRDKETGKSRGFAFLKYEDQRSTDLAVDNLGGTVIMGRTLRVDHTRYKKKDDEPDDGEDPSDLTRQIEDPDGENRRKRERSVDMESEEERPLIKEERELAQIIHEHNDEDPMKAYLIREKKEEIALALTKAKDGKRLDKGHRHRHHHRSRRHKDAEWEEEDTRRSRHSIEDHGRGTLRFKDDSPKDDGRHTRRLSETEIYGFKTRRRSPRTDSRDRDRERDNDRKWRRRDDAAEGSRRRTKRDSRDL